MRFRGLATLFCLLVTLIAMPGRADEATPKGPSGQEYAWALSPAIGLGYAGSTTSFAYGLEIEHALKPDLIAELGFLTSGLGTTSTQTSGGNSFLAGATYHLNLGQVGLSGGVRAGVAQVTTIVFGTSLSSGLALAAGPVAAYNLDLGKGVRVGPEISYLFLTSSQASGVALGQLRFHFRF